LDFDEAVKPVEKKLEPKVQKFEDEKVKEEPKEERQKTEWEKYFEKQQESYGAKVRQAGEKGHYSINIIHDEGTEQKIFTRKRLSVKELRWLAAKQKEYDSKPNKNLSLFEAEELASLYLEFAQLLLVDSKGESITKDEFESQLWSEMRAIVDDAILKSLIGSTG
jgi:hypothetical protein